MGLLSLKKGCQKDKAPQWCGPYLVPIPYFDMTHNAGFCRATGASGLQRVSTMAESWRSSPQDPHKLWGSPDGWGREGGQNRFLLAFPSEMGGIEYRTLRATWGILFALQSEEKSTVRSSPIRSFIQLTLI